VTHPALASLPRLDPTLHRLPNGLTVALLASDQAPVVTSALFYRAGTRDEAPGQAGIAHFLEHMMFKGSPGFAHGEIDRRTQALGGSNNAFTSHDLTAYHFSFASDRWTEGLLLEADRMAALDLDPEQVASERQVILEEIRMYDDEPWDALELAVVDDLFSGQGYGRRVLGSPEDLAAIGSDELRAFHRGFYRPANAVLVLAGDLGPDALERAAAAFGSIDGAAERRPAVAVAPAPTTLRRLTRRHGEVPRMLLALPAPAADHPDHGPLRLLVSALAGGRASRLHRALVDERPLCLEASADLLETQGPGALTIGCELLPGVEPEVVEAEVLAHCARLREEPLPPTELERVRQVVLADWVFGHQRVHQRALTAGFFLTLFDERHLGRQLAALATAGAEEVRAAARRWLDPERGATLGWSLPER
jgi:zinc protease